MTSGQARDAINGAAIVVAGLYFYRKLIEPTTTKAKGKTKQPQAIPAAAAQVIGIGPLASSGRFFVGFGFVFLSLSLVEGASAELAGYMALLIALGAILGNGTKVAEDISLQLSEKTQAMNKLAGIAEPQEPTVQVVKWESTGTTKGAVPA